MKKYNLPSTCQIKDLDKIYESYFDENKKNTFIEVGAYDGESFSNTSCLADNGWTGYYFEPIPFFAQKCALRHQNNKNIKVFQNGISSKEETKNFFFGDTLTTSNLDAVNAYKEIEWSKHYGFNHIIQCDCIRLDSFVAKHALPAEIELLVIDVEGNEYDVLSSFSLQSFKPKMLIVELEDDHPDIKKYDNLKQNNINARNLILNNNYREIYKDHINTVFIREK